MKEDFSRAIEYHYQCIHHILVVLAAGCAGNITYAYVLKRDIGKESKRVHRENNI